MSVSREAREVTVLELPYHCPIIALIMDNERAMIGKLKQGCFPNPKKSFTDYAVFVACQFVLDSKY